MNITFGFIGFFVSVIAPGLLFQRFYYHGEFSKQFTTKQPVINSVVHSIVPGILIHVLGLCTILTWLYPGTKLSAILYLYHDFLNLKEHVSPQLDYFFENSIGDYLLYILLLNILAIACGYLLALLVRVFNFDTNYKLFRYKNQWYYIFSGEVLKMKKFKSAGIQNVSVDQYNLKYNDTLLTRADILIRSNGSDSLYTGYIIDYDLNPEDISELDKIYLLRAKRYKRVELENAENNLKHPIKTLVRDIPGDIFVLSAKDMINMNITYVPNYSKVVRNSIRSQSKSLRKSSNLRLLGGLISLFYLASSWVLFFKVDSINFDFYVQLFESGQFNFWDRLLLFLVFNQLFGFLVAGKNKDGVYSLKYKFWPKFILFAIFLGVFLILNWPFLFS